MAKRKLTDVQTVYIDAKREHLTTAELSKILGFTEKAIQEYLDSNPVVAVEKAATPHTTESKKEDETLGIKPQFITKTQNGKSGISICTPQASDVGDLVRKTRKTSQSNKFKTCTTKIKDE